MVFVVKCSEYEPVLRGSKTFCRYLVDSDGFCHISMRPCPFYEG